MKLEAYREVRRAIASAEVEAARELRLPHVLDLDRLVIVWDDLVRDVDAGYWGSAYDYCHALTARDQLEAVLQRLENAALTFAQSQVEPLDAALLAKTTDDTRAFDPSAYSDPGAGWWWSRRPVNLGNLPHGRQTA